MNLSAHLKQQAAVVEKALRACLPAGTSLLFQAMRYSVCAGGKRLRPILVMESARLCGGTPAQVMPAACALEFIHTYSLIHDDLPAMDDDDLRRGKPTSHKKFGEAAAILAGDALLTDAFRLMASCVEDRRNRPARVAQAIAVLATAAGHRGMVAGQAKDTMEQGSWTSQSKARARRELEFIHLNKTAALLRASLLTGAILAGGTERQQAALDRYGRNIGLAFQIADDILDIAGDKKLLGKRGSDRDNNKLTYPAVYGLEASRNMAHDMVREAKEYLIMFGPRAEMLRQLADYVVQRQY